MSGPCLSSSVADHPLRPATRLGLGELLPQQQADRQRAPPKAPLRALALLGCPSVPHPALIRVSPSYSGLQGRLLTCYAPVCHSLFVISTEVSITKIPFDLHVLTTPPAFTLSQDQTLRIIRVYDSKSSLKNPSIQCLNYLFCVRSKYVYLLLLLC